jgi:hypothetical protein
MVSGLYKSKEWFFLHDNSLPEGNDYTDGWRVYYQPLLVDFDFGPDQYHKLAKLLIPQQLIKFKEN